MDHECVRDRECDLVCDIERGIKCDIKCQERSGATRTNHHGSPLPITVSFLTYLRYEAREGFIRVRM